MKYIVAQLSASSSLAEHGALLSGSVRLQEECLTEFRFDPDQLLAEEIVVDKLGAARRQMDSAVEMFFHDGDVARVEGD